MVMIVTTNSNSHSRTAWRRSPRWGPLAAGLLIVLLMLPATLQAQDRPFEGVTLTVITQSPPYIAKPLQMVAPEWEEMTGARIDLVTVPFGDLYTTIMSDFVLGAGRYDIAVFASAWMGDFAGNQYLVDITDWVLPDEQLAFDEIVPTYQDTVRWGGRIHGIPLDGDVHTLYYRRDALENDEYRARFEEAYGYPLDVPSSWDQYRDVAEFFHGWDWDGDGRVEYGAIEAMQRGGQAFWFFLSRAAPIVCPPDVLGCLFFDPETMEPRIDNPGFVRALEQWIEILEFGMPGMIGFDSGDVRSQFAAGQAALGVDWGDTGIIGSTSDESTIRGDLGTAVLPGATQVYHPETGEWLEFDEPNAAPFLAFGGWVGGIATTSLHAEAAYHFLAYLGSPENSYVAVTTPETGFNPYRPQHFQDYSRWFDMGFEEGDLELYLAAIEASLSHPNAQLDLKLPGQARYMDAAEVQLSRALAGEVSAERALQTIAEQWNLITDDLGRAQQLAFYRDFLGLD
jgi:multiple sugar transport system substrate-binding protein